MAKKSTRRLRFGREVEAPRPVPRATALAPSPLGWLPAALRASSRVRTLAAGERLFRQGDRVTAIFEVEAGRLRLVRHTVESHEVVLHTARQGELCAEAALFSGAYQCDAVAIAPSRVRAYPKRELLAALRGEQDLAERFMALLARQIHALRARLEERNIRSARERVLHRLVLAAGADGRSVRVEGTLMALAAELGLSHEALYRALAALERAGAIARRGGEIVLQKNPAL